MTRNLILANTSDSRADISVRLNRGLVWSEALVTMEQYQVRFERAVSECGSESSWYSYLSSGITDNCFCRQPTPEVLL